MNIEIAPIEKKDYEKWNAFVSISLNGTIFHKTFWIDAIGNNFDIWGLFINGNLRGGFVAPYIKFMEKKVIHQQFLTPYSGLVLEKFEGKYVNKNSYEKMVSEKFARFIKQRYKYGVLTFDPYIKNVMPFLWENYDVTPNFTYITDIKDMEKVWKGMDKKLRNEIKKGISNGLCIEVQDSFENAFKLVNKSITRKQKEFRGKDLHRYFNKLKKQDLCKSFICRNEERNDIATAVEVWDEKRMYNILNGYDEKLKSVGSVSLCIYESMKFASNELNCKEFDFEGSMIPSIEKFYRKHGGKLSTYYQLKWGPGIDILLKLNKIIKKYKNNFLNPRY